MPCLLRRRRSEPNAKHLVRCHIHDDPTSSADFSRTNGLSVGGLEDLQMAEDDICEVLPDAPTHLSPCGRSTTRIMPFGGLAKWCWHALSEFGVAGFEPSRCPRLFLKTHSYAGSGTPHTEKIDESMQFPPGIRSRNCERPGGQPGGRFFFPCSRRILALTTSQRRPKTRPARPNDTRIRVPRKLFRPSFGGRNNP